jgi:ribosomal protein L6P/L9E
MELYHIKNQLNTKLTGKKNRLIIPHQICVVYDKIKNCIIFFNKKTKKKKIIKLNINIKIFLMRIGFKLILEISDTSNNSISNAKKKKLKAEQGTLVSNIKYVVLNELFINVFCQRMRFIGIAYRAIRMQMKKKIFFYLRLGYSHYIYINFSKKLNFFCIKFTKLYIFGKSYPQVQQLAALIRSYRKPSIYKIKGILYENEKIKLKRGKRV